MKDSFRMSFAKISKTSLLVMLALSLSVTPAFSASKAKREDLKRQAAENDADLQQRLKLKADERKGALNTAKPDKKEITTVADPEAAANNKQMLQSLTPQTQSSLKKMASAMQLEAQGVSNELKDNQEVMAKDIAMLWQGAVEHSGSIRYAIEKLSRRDASGKPVDNDRFVRRMLQSVANLGGVATSMITGTPTGLIGSSMVEDLLLEDPTANPALSRVTDADMVILAKEIENLQSKVIESYYKYKQAQERWKLSQEAESTLAKYLDHAEKPGKTPLVLSPSSMVNNALGNPNAATQAQNAQNEIMQSMMSAMMDSAEQDEAQAKQAYIAARNDLALISGPDALQALEQSATASAK